MSINRGMDTEWYINRILCSSYNKDKEILWTVLNENKHLADDIIWHYICSFFKTHKGNIIGWLWMNVHTVKVFLKLDRKNVDQNWSMFIYIRKEARNRKGLRRIQREGGKKGSIHGKMLPLVTWSHVYSRCLLYYSVTFQHGFHDKWIFNLLYQSHLIKYLTASDMCWIDKCVYSIKL